MRCLRLETKPWNSQVKSGLSLATGGSCLTLWLPRPQVDLSPAVEQLGVPCRIKTRIKSIGVGVKNLWKIVSSIKYQIQILSLIFSFNLSQVSSLSLWFNIHDGWNQIQIAKWQLNHSAVFLFGVWTLYVQKKRLHFARSEQQVNWACRQEWHDWFTWSWLHDSRLGIYNVQHQNQKGAFNSMQWKKQTSQLRNSKPCTVRPREGKLCAGIHPLPGPSKTIGRPRKRMKSNEIWAPLTLSAGLYCLDLDLKTFDLDFVFSIDLSFLEQCLTQCAKPKGSTWSCG